MVATPVGLDALQRLLQRTAHLRLAPRQRPQQAQHRPQQRRLPVPTRGNAGHLTKHPIGIAARICSRISSHKTLLVYANGAVHWSTSDHDHKSLYQIAASHANSDHTATLHSSPSAGDLAFNFVICCQPLYTTHRCAQSSHCSRMRARLPPVASWWRTRPLRVASAASIAASRTSTLGSPCMTAVKGPATPPQVQREHRRTHVGCLLF